MPLISHVNYQRFLWVGGVEALQTKYNSIREVRYVSTHLYFLLSSKKYNEYSCNYTWFLWKQVYFVGLFASMLVIQILIREMSHILLLGSWILLWLMAIIVWFTSSTDLRVVFQDWKGYHCTLSQQEKLRLRDRYLVVDYSRYLIQSSSRSQCFKPS